MTAEDLLTRTFAEVTETTDYPTTSMATVVARSRALRGARRRRVAYVAAAAVVVVGGLSAAVALRGGGDTAPGPAGPLGGFEQGAPPKIDYLDGDRFVPLSGEPVTSPAFAKATDAVAWKNGVLVASSGTSRHPFSKVSFVSNGLVSRVGCGSGTFAVAPGGDDPVYWLSDTCAFGGTGRLVQGSTSTATAKGATFTPVGVVDEGVVAAGGTTPTGPRLPSRAVVIRPDHASVIALRLGLPRTATAAGGLVAGDARDFTGSAVVDVGSGAVVWRAPASWTLGKFSASGRYVVGTQSVGVQQPGNVGDVVGIWDAATGHQVRQVTLPGLVVDATAWEGDDSLLVVAEDRQGQEAILRVGLDGSVSRTTPVVNGVPRPAVGRPPLPTLRLAATP
jgi:hypothetical protein